MLTLNQICKPLAQKILNKEYGIPRYDRLLNIIELRLNKYTQLQIAENLKVSKERIRQLQNIALNYISRYASLIYIEENKGKIYCIQDKLINLNNYYVYLNNNNEFHQFTTLDLATKFIKKEKIDGENSTILV